MKTSFMLAMLLMLSAGLRAQKDQFDLVNYEAASAWKKETRPDVIVLTQIDKSDRSWCQVGIYRSIATRGSIDADFNSDWENLVAKPRQVSEPPLLAGTSEADGWQVRTGTGRFIFDGKPATVMLTTYSGYGKCVSIVATTGSKRYLQPIQDLVASVVLNRPEGDPVVASQDTQPAQGASATAMTHFDDGWTSMAETDWVRATRGAVTVLIHFGLKYDDDIRQDITLGCWNRLAAGRYDVQQLYRPDFRDANAHEKFLQADVTERSTGEHRFVSFLVESENGVGFAFEVITGSKEAFPEAFPDLDRLRAMSGYNKFAVMATDLTGNWASTSGAFAQYFNIYSGDYAGMNASASHDRYEFSAGGSFQAVHKGATGMAGNQRFFQEKESGSFSVNGWTLQTKPDKGDAVSYDAWFQAVKGGRILHLQNQQYTGMQYHLSKVD